MKLVTPLLVCALSALLVSPHARGAEVDDDLTTDADADEATPLSDSILSLSLSIDFTNAYVFRGIVQERDGFIAQPGVEAGFSLFESDDGPFTSLDLTLGLWNSLHTGPTGDPGGGVENVTAPDRWYEADFYTGLSLGLPGDLSFGVTYFLYTSPNASFPSTEELFFELGWDDSGLYGEDSAFGGIQPTVAVGVEFSDAGERMWLGVGIDPSIEIIGEGPVTLGVSLPVEVGLSLSDYYLTETGDNDLFGYLAFAAKLTAGLGFVPASHGAWEVYVKPQGIVLGGGPERATQTPDNPGGDSFLFVVTSGIGVTFE